MTTVLAKPIPFSAAVETIPVDEADDIDRIVSILRSLLNQHFQQSGRYRRDVHVKAHGCARGEFRVLGGLSAELSQGLFTRAASYAVVVRFSNSAPWSQADLVPDGRGLAIQVENVPGLFISSGQPAAATQDFLMVNHATFIARNVKDYLRLEEARSRASDHPIPLAAALMRGAWNPFNGRWREMVAAAMIAGQLPSHPASYTYFSMVPIRYGQFVAKYRVVPSGCPRLSYLRRAAYFATLRDAMRDLLAETLAAQELKFEFQMQLRTAELSMPVEDATVEWPQRESPYRTVAQLVLPRQELLPIDDCDNRAFDVWNALEAHRPLGGINRVRRLAYAVSASARVRQKLVE